MRILLDPLSGLFGGGGSSSSATTTNQQVGAEGNSGPVFGAVTVKGNSQKQGASSKNAGGHGGRKGGNANSAPSADAPFVGGTSGQGNVSGSGNVQYNVTTADTAASVASSNVAKGSIDAQNELALAAFGLASEVAAGGFSLAAMGTATVAGNASDVLGASQNFAGLYSGADPNAVIQNDSPDYSKMLLYVSIGLGVLALLKK